MLKAPETKEPKQPNIGYVRGEVTAMAPKWTLVEDCIKGEAAIKSKLDTYLPRPNATDKSAENLQRYENYVMRAVFYNVTRKTAEGLVGQVFSRDPIVVIPTRLQPVIQNVDGAGVTLDQQAKKGLAMLLSVGGFGLLTDYPKVDRAVSVAELEAGFIRPTIVQYHRKAIINWRYKSVGAKRVLSLLVLNEERTKDDGFEFSNEYVYRVLRLTATNECTVSTWRYVEDGTASRYEVVDAERVITDASGSPLSEIPFEFCGILNNDANIDDAPLYDLAVLNIAHYRNSADYEDSCYLVGQPTPFFSGLTEQWVNKVFKNKTIQMGSRAAIPLPIGGVAGLLQANPNSMPMEAMQHKEAQMAALGAKLIQGGSGKNTLGEAQLDEAGEMSTLATAAKNIGVAYTNCLKIAARMVGVSDTDVEYSLNTDFPASRLTPNERAQLVLEWQAGAITQSEMRAGLRKAGVANLDKVDYEQELKDSPPPVTKPMTNNQGKGGSNNAPANKQDQPNNGGNQAGV